MEEFKRHDLDLLIVYDGDNFKSPYYEKSGSLIKWKWQKVSETLAYYRGQGVYNPEDQSWTREGLNIGHRIYPRWKPNS